MSGARLRVLLVEDSYADARLVREALGPGDGGFEVRHLQRLDAALCALSPGAVDALLLDLNLPDSQGLDTFLRAAARFPETPIVLLTGLNDEAITVAALRQGAQDYVVKGAFGRAALPRILRHAVERKRAESAARAAQAAKHTALERSKDDLIGAVSHALRNPITVVIGAIDNLAEGVRGALTPKQSEIAVIARRNAARLGSIVDNLLDLSRLESGRARANLRREELAPHLREAVARFEAPALAKGLSLTLAAEPGLRDAWIDGELLAEVLDNLLDNALRFAKTRVALRAARAPLSGLPEAGTVVVEIANDGEPIPAARIPELFNKFVQLSRPNGPGYKGTGLGLAICKDIVALHGGMIAIESDAASGTRVSFTLSDLSRVPRSTL